MRDLGRAHEGSDAMKHFGKFHGDVELKTMQPEQILARPGAR